MAEDIRTTRTKNKIKDAFIHLLETESYEKVSVSDIAREAGINRVTFYTHYIDKPCLLADIIDEMRKKFMIDAIEHASKLNSGSEIINYSVALTNSLLDIALANKKLITIMSKKENGVIQKIVETQVESFVTTILNKLSTVKEFKYPTKTVVSFLVPAFFGLIFGYVVSKDPIPEDEFRNDLHEITINLVKSNIFIK